VRKMLEIAMVGPLDVVYDLGCGDGRILIAAVKDFEAKEAVGYEIREDLYKAALREVERQNLKNRVKIINGDLFNADISNATVITLYLTTTANERLKDKLKSEAKNGTRIVSHDFSISGWEPVRKENFNDHTIYLYAIPQSFQALRHTDEAFRAHKI
jgi:tRNA A58 N-methylase Trm61